VKDITKQYTAGPPQPSLETQSLLAPMDRGASFLKRAKVQVPEDDIGGEEERVDGTLPAVALETLRAVLLKAATSSEAKFRRLRMENPAVKERLLGEAGVTDGAFGAAGELGDGGQAAAGRRQELQQQRRRTVLGVLERAGFVAVDEGKAYVLPEGFDGGLVQRQMDVLLAARPRSESSDALVHNGDAAATPPTSSSPPTLATTVYCDDCGKARILADHEMATHSSSVNNTKDRWTCSGNLSRRGGCDVVDDELFAIAGSHALVFDALGIQTRLQLANSEVADFDAGENEANIDKYIKTAREEEVEEQAMSAFQGDANIKELLLSNVEFSDLVRMSKADVMSLLANLDPNCSIPTEANVHKWLDALIAMGESMPWLYNS